MNTKFGQFNDLHHTASIFVLPNVWNAKSALFFQQKDFPAIATSSAAVAESLGYEDGEQMPFNTPNLCRHPRNDQAPPTS